MIGMFFNTIMDKEEVFECISEPCRRKIEDSSDEHFIVARRLRDDKCYLIKVIDIKLISHNKDQV